MPLSTRMSLPMRAPQIGPRNGHHIKEGTPRRAADFVAFDCTSQEKAAHGHVVYALREVSKTASKGAQNSSHCPGNERCAVASSERYLLCKTTLTNFRPVVLEAQPMYPLHR